MNVLSLYSGSFLNKIVLPCSYLEKHREQAKHGWESRLGCSVSWGDAWERGHSWFVPLASQ